MQLNKKKAKAKVAAGGGGAHKGADSDKDENDDGVDKEEDAEKKSLMSKLEGVIVVDKPNVRYSDVAGLDAAKAALNEAVMFPSRFPKLFKVNIKENV